MVEERSDRSEPREAVAVAGGLYGLVLAGGRSQRMGRDKAALRYGEETQLARALRLAGTVCERVFVSLRAGQEEPAEARGADAGVVHDRFGEIGPLGGILSALAAHPEHPWLVLAVDLPFLGAGTLQHLLGSRDGSRPFTAYRSSHDGLPEPLCAIYEPSATAVLREFWEGRGVRCPRKVLINADTHLLDLPDPAALDNINTPEDYAGALARLAGGEAGDGAVEGRAGVVQGSAGAVEGSAANTAHRRVKLRYFALLRERRGLSEETLETGAATPSDLYRELRVAHGFPLGEDALQVAVNGEFAPFDTALCDGDEVVFIPPVAGG